MLKTVLLIKAGQYFSPLRKGEGRLITVIIDNFKF